MWFIPAENFLMITGAFFEMVLVSTIPTSKIGKGNIMLYPFRSIYASGGRSNVKGSVLNLD